MNAIKVCNLIKKYNDLVAVDNISFDVKKGEFFALLGENGAGKSTTINILCTILKKNSGDVEILGHNLDNEDNLIRNKIGIVFQNSVLDRKLTVKENLLTRASYYGLTKKEALEKLNPLIKMFEIEDILNQKYEKLSGGQRRRVDITRALINEPEILFLDEPTTGLDPKSRKIVWDYIHKMRKEKKLTIFLTTHYMEETRDCDRVVILDKGNIIENDTPSNLKSKYTNTKLLWYVEKKHDELLNGFNYSYNLDHYSIFMEEKQIIEFLNKNREVVLEFEVLRGTMDDVFLKLTGKELE